MDEDIWKLDFTDDCKNPLKKYDEGPYLIIRNPQEKLVIAFSNGL